MIRIDKNKVLIALPVLFAIIAIFLWYSSTEHTGAIVTVIEVRENEIVIKDDVGKVNTVGIPEGIYELINEDERYFVQYQRRKWQAYNLRSIKPSSE